MFDEFPLPLDWPVYVSHAEASAYARWAGNRCRPKPSGIRGTHRRAAMPTDGQLRFGGWDPRRSNATATGSAFGVPGSRQRLGVDLDGVRAVAGLRAVSVLPRLLGRILRRAALRDERRVAADGGMHAAAEFPQLVPAALPIRLCGIPLRRRVVEGARRGSGCKSIRHCAPAVLALNFSRTCAIDIRFVPCTSTNGWYFSGVCSKYACNSSTMISSRASYPSRVGLGERHAALDPGREPRGGLRARPARRQGGPARRVRLSHPRGKRDAGGARVLLERDPQP